MLLLLLLLLRGVRHRGRLPRRPPLRPPGFLIYQHLDRWEWEGGRAGGFGLAWPMRWRTTAATTQSRQSFFFLPPCPLFPSFPPFHPPSSIIRQIRPFLPSLSLQSSPHGWTAASSSVMSDSTERRRMNERTNERTNHSHFQKMRAAQKITSRLPSLRRNETKRGKGGREGRAHMDQIKGRLASNIGRQASEEGAPLSSCLVSSFVRSPLTIPPLSSEVGWRRSAPRLPVEPRCEEERERTIERRSLRSARSLSPLRASREGKGGREGGCASPADRAGGRAIALPCRARRGKRLFVVDDRRWRALSRAPPFPPARPARSELPSGSPVLIFCPVFHRVSLNCCPSRDSRTTIGRRIRPSTLIGLPPSLRPRRRRRRVQLCCER